MTAGRDNLIHPGEIRDMARDPRALIRPEIEICAHAGASLQNLMENTLNFALILRAGVHHHGARCVLSGLGRSRTAGPVEVFTILACKLGCGVTIGVDAALLRLKPGLGGDVSIVGQFRCGRS